MREAPGISKEDLETVRHWLNGRAQALGFSDLKVSDLDLGQAPQHLRDWLDEGRHGQMDYMTRHANLRADPRAILPKALRVLTLRMNYLPHTPDFADETWRTKEFKKLEEPHQAVVSLYARGRDYHKILRNQLQQLASELKAQIGPFDYRVCVDSAPVMEVEFAQKAGLGWRGKHTLLLNREAGSMFFLGEILIDLPLPVDPPTSEHCGACTACMDVCPTQAIVAPYQLDARRCISYLTIEHPDAIPEEFRPLMGNRIYGCDDCQLTCPWNKFAQVAADVQRENFMPRHQLDHSSLLQLWAWTEAEFLARHSGSAIRRIGYQRWLRNIAIALGNALRQSSDLKQRDLLQQALQQRLHQHGDMVDEHIQWALAQA